MIILGNHSSVNDYLRFCGGKAKGLYLLSEDLQIKVKG